MAMTTRSSMRVKAALLDFKSISLIDFKCIKLRLYILLNVIDEVAHKTNF